MVLGLALLYWLFVAFAEVRDGLPYKSKVDENPTVDNALRMLKTGDLNPYFHQYPPLLTHMCLVVDVLNYWRLCGREPGDGEYVDGMHDIGYFLDVRENKQQGFVVRNPSFFYANRALIVLLGLAMVLTTYLLGRHLAGPTAGVVAAILLIRVPLFTEQATSVVPNVPFSLAAALVLCFSLRYLAEQKLADLAAAGACAGLAAAFKYNAAITLVTPLTAIVCCSWNLPRRASPAERNPRWATIGRRALLVISLSAVVFMATNPYALLDLSRFVEHVGREIRHYRVLGHPGFESEPGLPHLMYQARSLASGLGKGWAWLALAGVVALLLTRRGRERLPVVLVFPLVYSALMSMQKVNFHRNWLPVYLYLSILSACAVVVVGGWAASRLRRSPALGRVVALSLVLALSSSGLVGTAKDAYAAYRVQDTRTVAVSLLAELVATETQVAVAEELRVHPVDLATLPCTVHVVPASSIPGSLGAVDYVLTAASWKGPRAPSPYAPPAGAIVASVSPSDGVAPMEAMGNQRSPSVLILKASPDAASLGPNLLANPGFEGVAEEIRYGNSLRGFLPRDGRWSVPEFSDPAMQVAQHVGEDVYEGKASLRLTRTRGSAANAFLLVKTESPLQADLWYQLSFAMSVVRGAGPDSIHLYREGTDKYHRVYDRVRDAGDQAVQPRSREWTVYRYSFRGMDGVSMLRFAWGFYSKFDVLMDRVELRVVNPIAEGGGTNP